MKTSITCTRTAQPLRVGLQSTSAQNSIVGPGEGGWGARAPEEAVSALNKTKQNKKKTTTGV